MKTQTFTADLQLVEQRKEVLKLRSLYKRMLASSDNQMLMDDVHNDSRKAHLRYQGMVAMYATFTGESIDAIKARVNAEIKRQEEEKEGELTL